MSLDNKGFLLPPIAFQNMDKSAVINGSGLYLCIEKRFSYDEFISKAGKTPAAIRSSLDRLEKIYQSQRERLINANRSGEQSCGDCIQVVVDELNRVWPTQLKVDSKLSRKVSEALRRELFGEFLFEVLDAQCNDVSMPIPKFGKFPEPWENSTRPELSSKMIEVIKMGYPVSYGPVCADRSAPDGCGQHNIVVSGYKKMCDSAGRCDKEAFKVHNSWGFDWQKKFTSDGWVDADALIDAYYRNDVASGSTYWLIP